MDALMDLLKIQSESIKQLTNELKAIKTNAMPNQPFSPHNIPWPGPLDCEGDIRENIEIFENAWKNYCTATGMDKWGKDKLTQRASLMLSSIGIGAMRKYMDFGLTEQDKISDTEALKKIKSCIIAKSNVIYDRYMFNSCNQLQQETFEQYLIKLQKLLKYCNYRDSEMSNELLRDRIVVGIIDEKLKKKLMEIPELTLDKVIDCCKIAEVTQCRISAMKTIEDSPNAITQVPINKINSSKLHGHENLKKKCKFCANFHEFKKDLCPAFGQICSFCKGKNHLEKACRKKYSKNDKRQSRSRVNEINLQGDQFTSSDDEIEQTVIAKIEDGHTPSNNNVTARLHLKFGRNWKDVDCMIDTGSNSCLIGERQYKNYMSNNHLDIEKSTRGLIDFNGNPIESVGEVKVKCRLQNQSYILVFQIIKRDHIPLLSSSASAALGLIQYSEHVNKTPINVKRPQVIRLVRSQSSSIKEAENIVKKYDDIFNGYGLLPGEVELEVDQNVTPVIQRPRRIPIAYRDRLKKELDELEHFGIIRKIERHTAWVSNILIVVRKNSFRICLDPIPLNKALKRPNYQFATIDEILPELGQAKIFSTCDAAKGFWQIKLTEASSELTCFWTPFGRYVWCRLPFGICSAPEIFQMKMAEVINDVKGVEILADDLLIYGSGDTEEEAVQDHNRKLDFLFKKLRDSNCKLNKNKLKLCQKSVKFYGHVLSNEGLQADESKIEAILNMKSPSNKEELQRFIGMVTYLSRFIKNLSTYFTPLRKLALENTPWIWSKAEQDEFVKIKQIISDIKNLKYFDNTKPVIIECDSSSTGLGAALLQENNVIAYASRTLTATERNYAQIEKELLAIVFGCTRFDQMVVGRRCIVRTDHKPLITIFKKPLLKAPKRLQLMFMILQRYSLDIQFIEGKKNILADTLSRAPLNTNNDRTSSEFVKYNICQINIKENKANQLIENIKPLEYLKITDERIDNIRYETMKDTTLQSLKRIIINGWPKYINDVPDEIKGYFKFKNELSTDEELILMEDRILIPQSLRKLMIDKVHLTHNGIESTLKLARRSLFWPGMTTQIKDKVKECTICAKYADSQHKPPMLSHNIPSYPFQFVSMDVFTISIPCNGKNLIFLVTVDHYSDYFELDILKDMSTKATIEACKRNFGRHGIPQRVLTDNGTNFASDEFRNFAAKWGFNLITSAPHHQQSNGKAEAAVKIAKKLIKKSYESGEELWSILLHWRNIPNKIQSSPSQRLFSRATRTTVPTLNQNLKPKIVENVEDKIEQNRSRTKKYYDSKSRQIPTLEIGQPVFAQINPEVNKLWSSGIVQNKLTDRSYLVNVNGSTYRRDLVHIKPNHKTCSSSLGDADRCTFATNQDPSDVTQQTQLTTNEETGGQPSSISTQGLQPEVLEENSYNIPTTPLVRSKRNIKLPEKYNEFIMK